MNRDEVRGESPPVVASGSHVSVSAASFGTVPSTETDRWAAWRERGVAHDRAVRRKLAILGPLAVAAAALAVWLLT